MKIQNGKLYLELFNKNNLGYILLIDEQDQSIDIALFLYKNVPLLIMLAKANKDL